MWYENSVKADHLSTALTRSLRPCVISLLAASAAATTTPHCSFIPSHFCSLEWLKRFSKLSTQGQEHHSHSLSGYVCLKEKMSVCACLHLLSWARGSWVTLTEADINKSRDKRLWLQYLFMSLFILSAVVYLHDLEVELCVCVWRATFKWVCDTLCVSAAKTGFQKSLPCPSLISLL